MCMVQIGATWACYAIDFAIRAITLMDPLISSPNDTLMIQMHSFNSPQDLKPSYILHAETHWEQFNWQRVLGKDLANWSWRRTALQHVFSCAHWLSNQFSLFIASRKKSLDLTHRVKMHAVRARLYAHLITQGGSMVQRYAILLGNRLV
jgi:hypothetical protein